MNQSAKPTSRSKRDINAKLIDPHNKMQDIIEVALKEFAEKGLSGARIDDIAALTKASKRMIYYYYGSKEALYLTVLESVYRNIRVAEAQLHLENLSPPAALEKLMRFTIDYKLAHPEYTRLITVENIHRAEYLKQSTTIQSLNTPAIDVLKTHYLRGVQQGFFRAGLDPVHIHLMISALSGFNVSNQHTFSLIFKRDFSHAKELEKMRTFSVEALLRYVSI
jgi:AcrR family transcriptional regulator